LSSVTNGRISVGHERRLFFPKDRQRWVIRILRDMKVKEKIFEGIFSIRKSKCLDIPFR
jgi:hypothetical protein